MVDIPTSKEALREQFQKYRKTMSRRVYAEKSAAICDAVSNLDEVGRANTVHVYWPQTNRREIDTRPLIDHLRATDKRIVLPRVMPSADGPQMEHVEFTGEGDLRTNRWGLREPAGSDLVAPSALDAVIVPAFGAGRSGHRIGHGRGFYDAFLEPLDVFTAGLVYAECLRERVPAEPHDVPLACLATEQGVVWATSREKAAWLPGTVSTK